jgi:hypothetical protein
VSSGGAASTGGLTGNGGAANTGGVTGNGGAPICNDLPAGIPALPSIVNGLPSGWQTRLSDPYLAGATISPTSFTSSDNCLCVEVTFPATTGSPSPRYADIKYGLPKTHFTSLAITLVGAPPGIGVYPTNDSGALVEYCHTLDTLDPNSLTPQRVNLTADDFEVDHCGSGTTLASDGADIDLLQFQISYSGTAAQTFSYCVLDIDIE